MATLNSVFEHRKESQVAPKKERLEARITAEQKALFLRAATLTGRSLTDFLISSVQEVAARTVRDYEQMALSVRDREVFVATLLEAPPPGQRLSKAAKRYRELID